MPVEVPPDYAADNLLTRWQKPVYSIALQQQKITGEVTIEFDVDRYGGLSNVQVVDSSPPGAFDNAVLKTLNWWTVVPYRATSCSAKFPRTRITVRFDLDKGYPRVVASRPMPLADPGAADDTPGSDLPNAEDTGADRKRAPQLRWKYNPRPAYPMRDNKLHPIPGDVVARITVLPDGSVGGVDLILSAPHPAFGEEITNTLKTWVAETKLGEPLTHKVKVCQPFRFRRAD